MGNLFIYLYFFTSKLTEMRSVVLPRETLRMLLTSGFMTKVKVKVKLSYIIVRC